MCGEQADNVDSPMAKGAVKVGAAVVGALVKNGNVFKAALSAAATHTIGHFCDKNQAAEEKENPNPITAKPSIIDKMSGATNNAADNSLACTGVNCMKVVGDVAGGASMLGVVGAGIGLAKSAFTGELGKCARGAYENVAKGVKAAARAISKFADTAKKFLVDDVMPCIASPSVSVCPADPCQLSSACCLLSATSYLLPPATCLPPPSSCRLLPSALCTHVRSAASAPNAKLLAVFV